MASHKRSDPQRPIKQPIRHPILGILVKPDIPGTLTGASEISDANLHLNGADQVGITAYLFTLGAVSLAKKSVKAWVRSQEGRWVRAVMPWPDILYEHRVQIIPKCQRPKLRRLRATTRTINTAASLGKWACHKILKSFPETRDLLPETVNHHGLRDLRRMLNKYPVILAKPEWGSGGVGISKIWRSGRRRFGWSDSVTGRKRANLTIRQVHRLIIGRARRRPFVIQQRLPLLEVEGRKMDIRVFMYKNGQGEWLPNSFRARIAAKGMFVTNKHRGGETCELRDALKRAGLDDKAIEETVERVAGLAQTIVSRIETGVGPMGEIGLDLALDNELRVWFIEANARPEKSTPGSLPRPDYVPPKYASTSQYALYLWEHRS